MIVVANFIWAGLFPVLRRVELTLALRNLEPLRIGVGKGESLGSSIDLPVYRQLVVTSSGGVVEQPVIPGSSMKGVLRTASMALAEQCGVKTHSGVGDDNCVREFEEQSEAKFDDFRAKAGPDWVRKVVAGFCPTCLLYGAPSVSSRVLVGDFVPEGPVRLAVKTGVGIDRRRGTVAKKVFYRVEFVQPGALFAGSMSVVNAPNWLLGLLMASIGLIGSGWVKLGGFKTRGMGRVEVDWSRVRLRIEHPGAQGKSLPVLDSDLDEEIELTHCSGGDGVYECRGNDAKKVIEDIVSVWGEACRKLKSIHDRRHEEAINAIIAVTQGGEKK